MTEEQSKMFSQWCTFKKNRVIQQAEREHLLESIQTLTTEQLKSLCTRSEGYPIIKAKYEQGWSTTFFRSGNYVECPLISMMSPELLASCFSYLSRTQQLQIACTCSAFLCTIHEFSQIASYHAVIDEAAMDRLLLDIQHYQSVTIATPCNKSMICSVLQNAAHLKVLEIVNIPFPVDILRDTIFPVLTTLIWNEPERWSEYMYTIGHLIIQHCPNIEHLQIYRNNVTPSFDIGFIRPIVDAFGHQLKTLQFVPFSSHSKSASELVKKIGHQCTVLETFGMRLSPTILFQTHFASAYLKHIHVHCAVPRIEWLINKFTLVESITLHKHRTATFATYVKKPCTIKSITLKSFTVQDCFLFMNELVDMQVAFEEIHLVDIPSTPPESICFVEDIVLYAEETPALRQVEITYTGDCIVSLRSVLQLPKTVRIVKLGNSRHSFQSFQTSTSLYLLDSEHGELMERLSALQDY